MRWESGKAKNPPAAPPQAWIYDAYFSDGMAWSGWVPLLTSFFTENWSRVKPAYEVAYKMAAYHHGHLTVSQARSRV